MKKTKIFQNKAIFIDRDGVINKNRSDYVKKIEELEILPNVSKAINLLNMANFKVIIISNQSVVNRGLITMDELMKIHYFLQQELLKNNAKIDAAYYCPHRPDELCECRKPRPGLILRAVKDLEISLINSLMIGDAMTDVEAATRAGLKSILMETNGDLLKIIKQVLK